MPPCVVQSHFFQGLTPDTHMHTDPRPSSTTYHVVTTYTHTYSVTVSTELLGVYMCIRSLVSQSTWNCCANQRSIQKVDGTYTHTYMQRGREREREREGEREKERERDRERETLREGKVEEECMYICTGAGVKIAYSVASL